MTVMVLHSNFGNGREVFVFAHIQEGEWNDYSIRVQDGKNCVECYSLDRSQVRKMYNILADANVTDLEFMGRLQAEKDSHR